MACFKTSTRGLNGDCTPAGTYEQIINNVTSVAFQAGTVPPGLPFAGCSYNYLVINGVSNYPSFDGGSAGGTGTVTQVDCASGQPITKYDCVGGVCQANTSGGGAYSSLTECQSSCAWYDCINGTCIKNTTYTTPGNYQSLADCNLACGGATCPVGQTCFDPNDLPCPTCPACPICPDCPNCPDCPDSSGICPACPTSPPGAATCPSGQTCQLPSGEDVNFVNISAPIFLGSCDSSGNPRMGTRSVSVIEGTESAEFLKFQELAAIQGAAVCQTDVAACPDGWLIRPEYHRSQVIYQFAEIDGSGNIIGAPKYKITVPHHIADQPTTPLPNYQRGNWETIYVLNDNSKIIVHSLDADNGNTMLAAIKLRIDPTYMTNAYLSKSSLVDTVNEIAQITVKNRMAKYYSTGAKSDLPDWIKKW